MNARSVSSTAIRKYYIDRISTSPRVHLPFLHFYHAWFTLNQKQIEPGPMVNRKGERRERELVNLLNGVGFAVMRAPVSGSATDPELPDVLAGNGESFYAIEAKSSSGNPIYLDAEEVEALRFFAENFGVVPKIGIRFDEEDWAFFDPNNLYVTEAGNYRLIKETAIARGADLFELAGESTQSRLNDLAPV